MDYLEETLEEKKKRKTAGVNLSGKRLSRHISNTPGNENGETGNPIKLQLPENRNGDTDKKRKNSGQILVLSSIPESIYFSQVFGSYRFESEKFFNPKNKRGYCVISDKAGYAIAPFTKNIQDTDLGSFVYK